MEEEEAAKAKKVEETNQTKKAASGTPAKSPRVKTVAPKRTRRLVMDEGSSSEELSDTAPLRQRRTKRAHDPLFDQQTKGNQASNKENAKANDGQESNQDQEEHTQQEQQVFRLDFKLVEIFLIELKYMTCFKSCKYFSCKIGFPSPSHSS